MEILDFLPEYPNEQDENFYENLYKKKEFYENRLEKSETFPNEKGMQTKYQRTISRYLSSNTPYNKLLLIHSPGLGKSCSAIGAIEQIIKEEKGIYTGAIILAKGEALLENFKNEIVLKCTDGKYIPSDYDQLTSLKKKARIAKLISFYKDYTYIKFARSVSKLSDPEIVSKYSNKIIVVDEIHNIKPQDQEEKETYAQFHRFFHLIKNCKVLFLSGTPMKDSPEEISTVMNLLLDNDKQLPIGKNFIEKYIEIDKKTQIKRVKPEKIEELKKLFKGKISFLRQPESSIPKEFIGEKKIGGLQHLIVNPLEMSKFQEKYYLEGYNSDMSEEKTGIYNKSKEATLFVYPDGSFGREGFNKYIIEKEKKGGISNFLMSDELLKNLKGRDQKETLEKIQKHSVIYSVVIKKILETKGNCFVYSSIAKGSGAILFSLLLNLFNFSSANGRETSKNLRYALLTKKTATDLMIRNVRDCFNQPQNMYGDYIKVIIGTKAVSEGYSFNNVIFESINTPHFNYSETAQAIARGIRLGSHNDLIYANQNPIVEIMQPVALPQDQTKSIDLRRYKLSEDKDIGIASFLRILMESAVDCGLNYYHNIVENRSDFSRECDYMKCNYDCDGIDMIKIKNGLEEKYIDHLTYNIYYSNLDSSKIKNFIEKFLRKNKKSSIRDLKDFLSDTFTEKHIENVLKLFEKKDDDIIDLQEFRELYSLSPVKQIIFDLEEQFKTKFYLNFSEISSLFNNNLFEILSALRTIINNNMIIKNRYGFDCYLREDSNIFYLIKTLSGKPDYLLSYYTENYFTHKDINFDDIFKDISYKAISNKINLLISFSDNNKKFAQQFSLFDSNNQLLFLKSAILSKKLKIQKNKDLRNAILNFFKSDFKFENDQFIITLIDPPICLNSDGNNINDWDLCDFKLKKSLEKVKDQQTKKLQENPFGIYGRLKIQNNEEKFWIIDVEKEKESRDSKSETRGENAILDKRMKFGKICISWTLKELLKVVISRLKINIYPEDFMDLSSKKLFEEVKNHKKKYLKDFISNPSDKKELKRILYWSSFKVKDICKKLQNWLKNNDLLQID